MLVRRWMAVWLVAFCARAAASDLFVIAHSDVELTRDQIVELYRGDRQFAGDVILRPTDNAAARTLFVSRALGMDEVRYESHWTRKSFREGLLPPVLRAGDADVASFVARTPGAVGYVRTAPPNVKILTRY